MKNLYFWVIMFLCLLTSIVTTLDFLHLIPLLLANILRIIFLGSAITVFIVHRVKN